MGRGRGKVNRWLGFNPNDWKDRMFLFSPREHRRKWELNLILWVLMFINWCLRFACPSNYALLWSGLSWEFSLKLEIQELGKLSRNYVREVLRVSGKVFVSCVNSGQTCEVKCMCHVPAIPLPLTSVVQLMDPFQSPLPDRLCCAGSALRHSHLWTLTSMCSCSREGFGLKALPLITDCKDFNCRIIDQTASKGGHSNLSTTGIYWKTKAHGW